MVRAVWNGKVIAESDETIVIEGNHYFPADAVRPELLRQSTTTTVCRGRAAPPTTRSLSAERRTARLPGTTPTRVAQRLPSLDGWRSGTVSRSKTTAARHGVVRSSTGSVAPTRPRPTPTNTPTPGPHPWPISPTSRSSTRSTATRPSSTSGHRGADRARPYTRSSITSPTTTPTTRSTLHASTSTRTPASHQGSG